MQTQQEAYKEILPHAGKVNLSENTTAGTNTGQGGASINSQSMPKPAGGSNARGNAQNSGQVGVTNKVSRQQRSEDAGTNDHDRTGNRANIKKSSHKSSGAQMVTEIRGSESRGDASIDDNSPLIGQLQHSAKAGSQSEGTGAGMRKVGVGAAANEVKLPAFTLSQKDHLSVESSVDVFQHQISDDQAIHLSQQPYGTNEVHHKSFGANQGTSVISDTDFRPDKAGHGTNTHGSSTNIRAVKNLAPTHNDNLGSMSNQSDGVSCPPATATPNSNAHCLLQSAPHQARGRGSSSNTRMHGQTDGKKKRRTSEKHASGNKTHGKRVESDGVNTGPGRSNSRGNGGQHMNGGPSNLTGGGNVPHMQQNFYGPQFFDSANNQFNPFGQSFPFMAGGSNQAPQVHFIAKKQQFIAQISPEQLMNGDKRPYTAQSLNNLSAGSKRAGAIYGANSNTKNVAAFSGSNHYGNSLNAKTHTGGFNFSNSIGKGTGPHKYSHSHQGTDDMIKPKIAGKDILQALSTSNGFQSGYHSDPYSSVIGSGGALPTTITHSNRAGKSKNRMLAKEKEQLYDETIKMKIMNNQLRDDAVKLKTKIKILENELNRKEKTIEDLFSHNQLIQQSQIKGGTNSSGSQGQSGGLMPLAQTAQKYQQETFLVMSLKKQIRELKYEVVRREEELEVLRKNIKNTKTKELEQEISAYRDECLRLRNVIEDVLKEGASHPIHQQALNQRMQSYNVELQQKNQLIGSLTEQLQQAQVKLDTSIISGSQANTHLSLNGYQNINVQMDQSPSGVRENNMTGFPPAISGNITAGNVSQMNATQTNIRTEKSADRAQKTQSSNASAVNSAVGLTNGQSASVPQEKQSAISKEVQRDLQRARKTLREKDKELMKLKADMVQLKRERQEAGNKEREAVSGAEGLLKTMKEKLKQTSIEMKRRDERQNDMESKLKKLEELLKERADALKVQEDANKSLKDKLKAAKSEATKKQKEQDEKKNNSEQKRRASAKTTDEVESKRLNTEGSESAVELAKGKSSKPAVDPVVKAELRVITLIGQREKLCRDDLTAMILSGEEALKMLIKKPSEKLIEFIRSHLDDEDAILMQIPRFDIPKADFETQVLREMRLVLRDNSEKIAAFHEEELLEWDKFVPFYEKLENFEYPHKDKLLDFIKYFFLDHIETADRLLLNYAAFKEHITAKRMPGGAERTRNESGLKSRRRSHESGGSIGAESEAAARRRLLGLPDETGTPGRSSSGAPEEERMLDVAEQCFMRIADLLHQKRETVKQAFGQYSQPESFKDGTTLDLIGPRTFLAGVREVGFDDITELEAQCLLKVLAKPELDGAVILNEFILIMENFGIPAVTEEDEYENDYVGDTDDEKADKEKDVPPTVDVASPKSDSGKQNLTLEQRFNKAYWQARKSKAKHPILIRYTDLKDKALKVLKKLARFLLERYMHPREFFGPTIKKEIVGKKNSKVEVIKLHDFYLRLKLASIRKKLKEKPELNEFLAIDGDKIPGFVHVKRLIRALELIAEGEQEILVKEQQEKERLAKEKFEQEQKERAQKGLPPLKLDGDEDSKSDGGKEKKKSGADSIIGKDNEKKGGLDEMLKLGAGPRSSSPQAGAKEGPAGGPNRFSSQLGPQGHLNTIEEDLHETQTSHYSQQVKEGDGTDRDGASSRHQLSTSNHLRNSNALHELDDSARRSINNASLTLPGRGTGSGSSKKNNSSRAAPNASNSSAEQYSGGVKGSNTSPKRETYKAGVAIDGGASSEKGRDISDFDVCIDAERLAPPAQAITKEQIEENLKAEDEDEKEDLESEVDKKIAQVLENDTQKTMQKGREKDAESSDEYYEDEHVYDDMARGIGLSLADVPSGAHQSRSNSHRDGPAADRVISHRNAKSQESEDPHGSAHELTTDNRGEDTIKTDKIEAAVEEEMNARSKIVRIGGVGSSVDHSHGASAPHPGRGGSHVFDSAQQSAYGDSQDPTVHPGLNEMLVQNFETPGEKPPAERKHESVSVAVSGQSQPLMAASGASSKSAHNAATPLGAEKMLVSGSHAVADEGVTDAPVADHAATSQKTIPAQAEAAGGSDYTYDDDQLAEQLEDEGAATAALQQQLRAEHGLVTPQVAEDEIEDDYEI